MTNILLGIHLLLSIALIILVILQQGKGSEMGAAFGGGSSQSLFGARGSANFLSRTTSVVITLFFITSLSLAFLYNRSNQSQSIIDSTMTNTVIDTQPEIPTEASGQHTWDEQNNDIPQAPE